MRISDWSSDVCSSDLKRNGRRQSNCHRRVQNSDCSDYSAAAAQPSAAQPSAAQPSAAQPSAAQPAAAQPSAGAASTGAASSATTSSAAGSAASCEQAAVAIASTPATARLDAHFV